MEREREREGRLAGNKMDARIRGEAKQKGKQKEEREMN